MREFFYGCSAVNIPRCFGLLDYRQGMIDGLELALDTCERCDDKNETIEVIRYYLKLIKEDKFEKLKTQLGAIR